MAEIIPRHFLCLIFNTMRITPCRNGHGAGLTLRFALTDPYGIALLSNCSLVVDIRIKILDPYGIALLSNGDEEALNRVRI